MKKLLFILLLSLLIVFSGCDKTQPIVAPVGEETGNQNTIIVSDSWDQQRITTLEQEITRLEKENEQLLSDYQDLQTNITNCNTMIADAQSHSDDSAAEMKEVLENLHSCYEEYDREYAGE